MAEYTNEQIQNFKIIEAKMEYSVAASRGDQAGIEVAQIKAGEARAAGGTIPADQPLTQDMINAYTAYKEAGGTIPGVGLASLFSGSLFGIPIVYLLIGAGALFFILKKKS